VALPVAFQAVDVDLGNLLTAAVGDVIRLGAALDAPLQLQAPDGRSLLPAYLGRIGDSIAIEIAPR
jgi:flagellar motor switch protein FliM